MEIVIKDPEYFVLIHKRTGKKYNTFNSEIIKYDDEKFDLVDKTKQPKLL